MTTKWMSEEVWRRALKQAREQLSRMERPGYILFHHWQLDEAYTKKKVFAMRRSLERIRGAGLADWQERDRADQTHNQAEALPGPAA